VGAEAVAVALGGGQRGVEAHADHVDDLGLLEHRHAGEADVGQEAADMDVDVVLDQQFFHLAPADVGLRFVVRDHDRDRPAVDAAVLVDAVDRHLQADQGGLAAGRRGARERLQRPDLERLGLAEGGLPRRRHQHGGAERTGGRAVADQAAAGDFAGIPKRVSLGFTIVVGHGRSLCGFPGPGWTSCLDGQSNAIRNPTSTGFRDAPR
jgi:hypothetical protein